MSKKSASSMQPFNLRSQLRTVGGVIVFLLIVSVTLYPMINAMFFSRNVSNSFDQRQVLSLNEQPPSAESHVFGEGGMVSIAFDDGWLSAYLNAAPILDEYGYRGTFYIMSNHFDDFQYMSTSQADSLKGAGHELGSHTVMHPDLTSLSQEELIVELLGSKLRLEEKLGAIRDFASPYGKYNEQTLEEIKKHYRSHRTVAEGINTFENFNIYELLSPNLEVNTPTDKVQSWLDEARAKNGWVILTYHEINHSGNQYSLTPEQFAEHMQMIKNSGMKVMPIGAVLDEIARQYGPS